MSPTERELRAALHEGEGDPIDAGQVIAHAAGVRRAQRAQRRQWAAIGATVVAIAGLTTGGVWWAHGVGDNETHGASNAGSAAFGAAGSTAGSTAGSSAGPAAGGGTEAAGSQAAAATSAAASSAATDGPIAPGPLADAAKVACPTTLPTSNGLTPTTGALVSGPVEAIKVCAYADDHHPLTAADGSQLSAIYTGATATELAVSLNAASSSPVPVPACAVVPGQRGELTVLIPIDTGGRAGRPVVAVQQTCVEPTVTNGATIRYGWTAPASLSDFLAAARAAAAGNTTAAPPPSEHGSPISS